MPANHHEDQLRKKSYLLNKTLVEHEYKPKFPDEYELCVFCWCRISERLCDDDEGFRDEEYGDWICCDCAKKYAETFHWTLIPRKKKTLLEILAEEEDYEIPII